MTDRQQKVMRWPVENGAIEIEWANLQVETSNIK
jgi:hypothetical protein